MYICLCIHFDLRTWRSSARMLAYMFSTVHVVCTCLYVCLCVCMHACAYMVWYMYSALLTTLLKRAVTYIHIVHTYIHRHSTDLTIMLYLSDVLIVSAIHVCVYIYIYIYIAYTYIVRTAQLHVTNHPGEQGRLGLEGPVGMRGVQGPEGEFMYAYIFASVDVWAHVPVRECICGDFMYVYMYVCMRVCTFL
jgi:hypothetical protein